MPDLKNRQILACPSATETLQFSAPLPGFPQGILEKWSYHYAINDVKVQDADPPQRLGAAFQPLAAFTKPAETILILDGWPATAAGTPGGDERHEMGWHTAPGDPEQRDVVHHPRDDGNPRHTDGFNMVLCDGHAKWRKRDRQADGTYSGGTKDSEWFASQP